jgi:hypothetical protein
VGKVQSIVCERSLRSNADLGLNAGGTGVQKLSVALRKLNWVFALLLALAAAFIYRDGYEEAAAVIWLASLIILLPIWRQQG